jgi:three-Cys-motif partner protein
MAEDLGPKYETDEDGLPREIVGAWVAEKHARVRKYVDISRGPRAGFVGSGKAGASFIDLYAGPGRARIKSEKAGIDGSPLVAWHASVDSRAPFTQVHVADAHGALVGAAEIRLQRVGAPVHAEAGPATETVDRVLSKLNRHGLHVALLDPFNLEALPFAIIRKLAAIDRMDIIIHVSGLDLQRNLREYIAQEESALDAFAPRWREHVNQNRPQHAVRAGILEHWKRLIAAEGMTTARTLEKVRGPNRQPLYWLAFAARHPLALEFWEKIVNVGPERQLHLV